MSDDHLIRGAQSYLKDYDENTFEPEEKKCKGCDNVVELDKELCEDCEDFLEEEREAQK